jgi:septum formation protein
MLIVLASASPRRRQLLEAAGYSCDVHPMDVDETRRPGEPADHYVMRVARLKADAAAARFPDRIVLAADTAVVADEEVFGKPADAADAARMLRALAGRPHRVLTGVAVRAPGEIRTYVETTTVWFSPLSEADIAWYVASGEPSDKAGAYAVQGLASRFVTRIDGSYANVVGLPVASVALVLGELALPGTGDGREPAASV